ncbi:e3 ubiquitin-protein ligase [Stylonychia lemnae]|uniref:E3 ubiquitin-protein ligase n=1 Tax=Stylonychia lemnae TaxID=5949 RepID=A0A078AHF2_STYLE|nr:e3 ubiquitin-protein ligase [Stylonychia lemnae]|eukprot:CDW80922.1 e3 ubiquitin-protein ligase [Stylonychia lemnae]
MQNPNNRSNGPEQSLLFHFDCDCGQVEVDRVGVKKHYFKCIEAKNQYEDLTQLVMKLMTQSNDRKKLNLSCILSMLSHEIQDNLKIEQNNNHVNHQIGNNRPQKFEQVNQVPPKNIGFNQTLNQSASYNEDMNEFNFSSTGGQNLGTGFKNPQFDEQAYFEQMRQLQYQETCKYCERVFTECASKSQQLKCPDCGGTVQEWEAREILTQKELEEIENLQKAQLLAQNKNLVSCSCGEYMEVVPGKIDMNQKDDKGAPISQDAAVHMSMFRVRCNNCQKNFCAKCQSEPYHLGKTCEQHKEFKEAAKCRYCLNKLNGPPPSMNPAFKEVCRQAVCIDLMAKQCAKMLACGHPCCGIKDEKECLPCLHPLCVKKNPQLTLDQNADEYCGICYTEGLGQAPCVQLECNHIYHIECIMKKVMGRWPGPRIVFGFLDCPGCKGRIKASKCEPLNRELALALKIEEEVIKKAVERSKYEGLEKDPRIADPNDIYYNNIQKYAMYKLAYYQCFQCKIPYFGGMKDCIQAQQEGQQYKLEELVCGKCSAVSIGAGIANCQKHGTDYIEFKCRFCCSLAQWFCWGTTHFCEPCHKRQVDGDYVSKKTKAELPQCGSAEKCPLKLKHPENGDEFAMGCAVCRNEAANQKDF